MLAWATEVDAQFCERGEAVSGSVEIAELARLRGEVAEIAGAIQFQVAAVRRPDGKACVVVEVHGLVPLACQRCLGVMRFPLAARRALVFADPPSDLEDEDDDVDYVGPGARFGVLELVEEEALLCLPMVARHEPGDCPAGLAVQKPGDETHPFAVLRAAGKH